MKVLRVYHAGRDAAHRERDRALVRAGSEILLVVPQNWPEADDIHNEPFEIVELPVRRPGDVNRHTYLDQTALTELVASYRPDVVDLHEEPFSSVAHQWLSLMPTDQRVVGYTAQNIDKRFPPPFWLWERQALARFDGLYPCSRQAASVAVGKGFRGPVRVLPLAASDTMKPGPQTAPEREINLLLVGRLVPEKGASDAVRVLARLKDLNARLHLVGEGPEAAKVRALAAAAGVGDRLEISGWMSASDLARCYQQAHVLLAPSRSTHTWVEQFGRMAAEAQACGAVVVGYASGALPEVVGSAGILVPEGDEDALVASVRRVASDSEAWSRLRKAGLETARYRTWDAVAQGQLALYDEIRRPTRLASTRAQRSYAVATWGPPATLPGSSRPVALPILRDHDAANRLLGRGIDALSRSEAALPSPTAPLRVVYLDHVARISGGELALLRMIPALPNVQAHVILGEDGPLRPALEAIGATVEVLPIDDQARDLRRGQLGAGQAGASAAVSMLAYTWRLSRRLRELKPDLVHTNSLKAGYYGSAAARLAGIPVVWHLRDRIAEDYLPRPAVHLTHTLLRTMPQLVIANSETTLATSVPARGASPRGYAISDPFEPTCVLSAARDEPVIGIVGRISPWKGQDVFLRALAQLTAEFPTLEGRIIGSAVFGEDDHEQKLHDLAEELGLANTVEFTGHVDDVESELQRLMILVHASTLPEPFGQVIVEGMAAGLPVIATDAGGPSEIITNGQDGILVPPGDVEALARAIRSLIKDPDMRAKLAAHAVEKARDYVPVIIGPQIRALYDEVLGQSRDGS